MKTEIIDGKEYIQLECKISANNIGAGEGAIWILKSDLIEAVFGKDVKFGDGKINPFYKPIENTGR